MAHASVLILIRSKLTVPQWMLMVKRSINIMQMLLDVQCDIAIYIYIIYIYIFQSWDADTEVKRSPVFLFVIWRSAEQTVTADVCNLAELTAVAAYEEGSARGKSYRLFIARQHTDARYWYSKSVCLSVCLSVRNVPVSDKNGLSYRHSFCTIR